MKKIKKSGRLVVSTETVRSLTDQALADIGGGTSELSKCVGVCSTAMKSAVKTRCTLN